MLVVVVVVEVVVEGEALEGVVLEAVVTGEVPEATALGAEQLMPEAVAAVRTLGVPASSAF